MQENRRDFLKKSLKIGTLTAGVVATAAMANPKASSGEANGNGVVKGNSRKKEVLYHKTNSWEKFYKVAY